MTRNSRRLQKAVQAIFNDYREKASCPGQVYQNAACGCDNALQMWRGPKGEKGDTGPQGPKGDNAGSFLVDAEFVVDPEGQEPGAYLKLVLIDVAQQEQVVYVDLSYLTDIYEGGNGISIVDMVVAARLGAGLTFDANGNIASAYQFCDGLDETSNVVKVRLDSSNRILGFASGTCGGLTATVGLAPSATGVNLVLTGAGGTVLSTVPLEGGTGITVQKNAQTGGFTWLADPAGLVSSQTGNQLSVSQTDNKLYVGGNTLEYTFGTGAFTLKDSSGATLSSVTVPSAVRMLEDMELRTDDGIYLHLTYLRDNGLHAYQDVSLDGLLCHNIDTADDTAAAYSKAVPSGNWQTASINEIGGRTVVWNQLADFTTVSNKTTNGVTFTVDVTNGTVTANGTAEADTTFAFVVPLIIPRGHKIFMSGCPVGGGTTTYRIYDSYNVINADGTGGIANDFGNGIIYYAWYQGAGYTLRPAIKINSGAVCNNVVFRPRIVDLTQMFGAGNEPATVDDFRAIFPNIDPAYDTGTLKSAGVTEVVSNGENVMPPPAAGTTTVNGITAVSDGNGIVTISGTTSSTVSLRFDVSEFTIPLSATASGGSHQFFANNSFASGVSSINFYYNNIQIDSWNLASQYRTNRNYTVMGGRLCNNWRVIINTSEAVTIDGTIAPAFMNDTSSTVQRYNFKEYFHATLPVPAAVQALPGYGWSAGTVYNYVDYARKVYVQRVGSVDLGSLDYDVYQRSGFVFAYGRTVLPNVKIPVGNDDVANAICPKYITASYNTGIGRSADKTIGIIFSSSTLAGKLWLCDSAYTTATDLKAALQGVMLYYELAEPIETDISSLLTDNKIEVEPGGTLTFKNQNGDDFRLPVPNSETFIYEHPWVFEDCIKELVWRELEPYSSSIVDVSASFSCGSDYTWYISALHPWCDTEGDDCGGTVYSAPAVMPTLGTDVVMPAKILEKYSSVDIVISTAPISIITTDTSPTEFKYVTDAAHADAPYMAYELYSPYGAYYSFISAEEWAAASVGDLVELVSGRNVVEEHRAFKGAGNFDGSQLPPMQQCPLSDIPFRVFVVKETDSAIPDWPTGDIHIRVLQREGVEIPVAPTTLTLTTTDVSGETHEQEIDMSCISAADISLDAHCEDVVTPAAEEPFDDYLLSGSINTLLLEQDGTISDLKHANPIPVDNTARGSFTMELFNPENTDGLSIELYVRSYVGSDGTNSYSNVNPEADSQKCATLADFLDAGEQGLPLPYVGESSLSGVRHFAENETLYASVVSNGNNSYTFTFTVRTPEVVEQEPVLDLVSGENRTDLKPLLEHVGGKVTVPTLQKVTYWVTSDDVTPPYYAAADFDWAFLDENGQLVRPSYHEVSDDYLSLTFMFYDTIPVSFDFGDYCGAAFTLVGGYTSQSLKAYANIKAINTSAQGSPYEMATNTLAEAYAAGAAGVPFYRVTMDDVTGNPVSVDLDDSIRVRFSPVSDDSGDFKVEVLNSAKTTLCLEPSCDPCIDLSPVMDTVDEMIDGKIAPVQEQITQNASDIDALETKTDITNKDVANIQALLNGTLYREETDSTAAYSKAVPSSAMPWASVDMLGGRTVVWNQWLSSQVLPADSVLYNQSSYTANGVTITKENDGGYSISTDAGGATAVTYIKISNNVLIWALGNTAGRRFLFALAGKSATSAYNIQYSGTDLPQYAIRTSFVSGFNMWIAVKQGAVITTPEKVYPMVFDLTLMFGTTIADEIYAMEQATPGAGVAYFQSMFPAAYYAYDAGTLKSAGVTEVVSEGKNLFDITTLDGISGLTINGNEFSIIYSLNLFSKNIFVNTGKRTGPMTITGEMFYHSASLVGLTVNVQYTDNSTVSSIVTERNQWGAIPTITTDPAKVVKRVFFSYASSNVQTDVRNLQVEWGASATAYAPYRAPISYPVPSQIQALPGYGWSAGTVYNYVDYERKVYVQRVGAVDLGTLDWGASSVVKDGTTYPVFRSNINAILSALHAYATCSKYQISDANTYAANLGFIANSDKTMWVGSSYWASPALRIVIRDDSYTDAASFKTSLSGVMLYYELATPVETDISQYLSDDNLINVEAGGTLTFKNQNGDNFRLPVPNSETYIIDIQEAVSNG